MQPINVLVLCTGNSARSVLGECLINSLGEGRWRGFSAGSHPKGAVNPTSLAVLTEKGHSIEGLRSKSWDEFALPDAPKMDLVITVCHNAAGEVCPIWPGAPRKVHIGFPDPSNKGSHEEQMAEFRALYDMMEAKVKKLIEVGPDRVGEV